MWRKKDTARATATFKNISVFPSLGSVFNHVQSLKKKGIFPKNTRCSRSLVSFSEPKGAGIDIPLIGCLKGGMPIETYAQVSMMSIPSSMVTDAFSTYLLKVVGSQLEEEWICEGDLLLVHSKSHFENKDMVLAQVGGQTTFVKKLFYDPPYIRLESSNPEVQPLILREDHVQILGVIVGMMRFYL